VKSITEFTYKSLEATTNNAKRKTPREVQEYRLPRETQVKEGKEARLAAGENETREGEKSARGTLFVEGKSNLAIQTRAHFYLLKGKKIYTAATSERNAPVTPQKTYSMKMKRFHGKRAKKGKKQRNGGGWGGPVGRGERSPAHRRVKYWQRTHPWRFEPRLEEAVLKTHKGEHGYRGETLGKRPEKL